MGRAPSLKFEPFQLLDYQDAKTKEPISTVLVTIKFAPFGESKRQQHSCYPKIDTYYANDLQHWAHFARLKKNLLDDQSLESWAGFMFDSMDHAPRYPHIRNSIPTELIMELLLDWQPVPYDEYCERRNCPMGEHNRRSHKAIKWIPPTNGKAQ